MDKSCRMCFNPIICSWPDYLRSASLREFHGGFSYTHIAGRDLCAFSAYHLIETSMLLSLYSILPVPNQFISEESCGIIPIEQVLTLSHYYLHNVYEKEFEPLLPLLVLNIIRLRPALFFLD